MWKMESELLGTLRGRPIPNKEGWPALEECPPHDLHQEPLLLKEVFSWNSSAILISFDILLLFPMLPPPCALTLFS